MIDLRSFAVAALALLLLATPVQSVNPNEMLADPVLEARAREISKVLRCVLCRNQSIDDSNAGIARSMRIVLRERLVAGDSDEEAVQFLVDRYGDYVLLDPPIKPVTYLLWGGPAILLVVTVFGFAAFLRKSASRPEPNETGMSDEDRALIAALLVGDEAK